MAGLDPPPMRAVAPVASVWCRQVDNEAESPGYTTIPDDFAGLRETLESIRIVGNLTINIADTHDYWDPGPSQALSFYPNLFLYPAAGHRYTCVGRMFLSTEDRPRLGMKTLVFSTADLLASGDFGGMILRAHATMDGRGEIHRLAADPEPAVYQAVGDGFLFGKGMTDPVVIVASDQWEATAQTVLELVGAMPAALVALGAFLVFPYFLPAAKVNLSELSEQLPTALAVMRVARGEASGDRHEKRMKSWEELSVTLRDLTKPPAGRKSEALPLVLQYIREHADEKEREVARRVDAVELPRIGARLSDSDRPTGRDRRKEMWRIGAAMETAALLLSKPKGRSVAVSGDAAKRANEYLQARPVELSAMAPPEPPAASASSGSAGPSAVPGAGQHPAWLRPPPQVAVSVPESVGVPVSTSDDPSLLPLSAPAPPGAPPPREPEPRAAPRGPELPPVPPGPPVDLSTIDARVKASVREQETKWAIAVETRLREAEEAQRTALQSALNELGGRLGSLEARPAIESAIQTALRDQEAKWSSAIQASREELDARLGTLESRPAIDAPVQVALRDLEAKWSTAMQATQSELDSRLAALEGRPGVDAPVQAALRDQEAKWSSAIRAAQQELAGRLGALEARPAVDAPVQAALRDQETKWSSAIQAAQKELATRLGALEARPAIDPAELARQVDVRVKTSVDERSTGLGTAASQAAGDAWSTRFSTELQNAIEQFDARAAKSEEELRAALVAQLDVELSETREQGTALREEIEGRVRKIIDERGVETSQRLAREVHDLEQRLSVFVEGRSKDLETRLTAAATVQKEKLASIADERVARVEQRVALEREARLGEIAEAQTEALAGLQVRMQSFVEGKLRENLDKEREQTLGLFARAKLDTEQALARTVDAGHLDTLLNERLTELLERAHSDQSKAVASAVAHSEGRIRAAQQELLARLHHLETNVPSQAVDVGAIERTVRRELDDFDRRLKVVHDTILPMVRQTWLKVSQQEFGGSIRDLKESLQKEIQRVETTLLAENDLIRERMETAVAQHGRIWLNLIQQISREEGALALAPRGRGRGGLHRATRPLPAPPPAPSSDGTFPPEATAGYGRPPLTAAEARAEREAAEPAERRRVRRPTP
ncbi:MAG: hypothetical protein ACLP78_03070 [Thermoplasmata archaeon]